jgi:Flp pilus assembly protein TadD
MSLLMEALKKAERAKQAVEEQEGQPAAAAGGGIQLSPDDPAPAAATDTGTASPGNTASKVVTPARDPRQRRLDYPRLELESIDDKEFELDPVKPRAPRVAPADAAAEERNRAAARAVFDAKQPVVVGQKSRTGLIIGAIAAIAAIGAGGYLWMQTQTTSTNLINPQQAAGTVTRPPVAPVAPPAATVPSAPAPIAASQLPPEPGSVPTTAPSGDAGKPAGAPAKTEPVPPAIAARGTGKTTAPKDASTAAPAAGRALSAVRISAPIVSTDPVLEQAYAAYLNNDLAGARARYQSVLARDPDNRDVLLGLAGIATRERRLDDAESLYLRILQLEPTDAYAQTGLIAIRSQADPLASESRLKTLIASQPDAAYLHSALGNLYARLARWNEAQQEYFRAFSLDAASADDCYNLAVSLDQMRETQLARSHYERALALSASRPASFDPSQLRARISELKQK